MNYKKRPVQHGDMAERLKAPVSKTGDTKSVREFESLYLHQLIKRYD